MFFRADGSPLVFSPLLRSARLFEGASSPERHFLAPFQVQRFFCRFKNIAHLTPRSLRISSVFPRLPRSPRRSRPAPSAYDSDRHANEQGKFLPFLFFHRIDPATPACLFTTTGLDAPLSPPASKTQPYLCPHRPGLSLLKHLSEKPAHLSSPSDPLHPRAECPPSPLHPAPRH